MFRCISNSSLMRTHSWFIYFFTTSTIAYMRVVYFGEGYFIYISIFVLIMAWHAYNLITSLFVLLAGLLQSCTEPISSLAFQMFIGLYMTKNEHINWAIMQHAPRWCSFFLIFNLRANTKQYECVTNSHLKHVSIFPSATCMDAI